MIAQARKEYHNNAHDSARDTLNTSGQAITRLLGYESQLETWKSEGYDVRPLEQLKNADLSQIASAFQKFDQQILEHQAREQQKERAEYLVTQATNLFSRLKLDGAIIPITLDSLNRIFGEQKYPEAIAASDGIIAELIQIRGAFDKASAMKSSVTDAGALSLYNSGHYKEFIQAAEQLQEASLKLARLKEKGIELIGEIGRFAVIPADLRSKFEEIHEAKDLSALESTVSELELFRNTAKPDIEAGLDNPAFSSGLWVLTRVILKNSGSAHATDVLIALSDEFQTKGIKPVSVSAGSTTPVEFTLMPKNAGRILLEISMTFKDLRGWDYQKTQELWIDVTEKGGSALSPAPAGEHRPLPPLTSTPPKIIRAFEFYAGYIRVKISVKNPTPLAIHDVILEPGYDHAILYLERHEPDKYPFENDKIILGTINPGNDRTVSLYLEPTICAKEGTDIHCHIRYKDAQGKPGSLDMEPLQVQVVCPILETQDAVNIGSLKQLIETLPVHDSKIFSVPGNIDAQTQLKLFQGIIQLHDIRHTSTLRRANNFESWYYGRTKVMRKEMVIKLAILKDMGMVEITAYCSDPKDLTGLLAEINRHVTDEIAKRNHIQNIINVTIKDSVIVRSNLLNSCDINGTCSGDVTIVDSVVTNSNIG
ncbi:MAG: hypothetical protein GYA23_06475 [Methanomicrobiales archaeon]|nr:hypothetical protein [Methanomicrobiales archaeon]